MTEIPEERWSAYLSTEYRVFSDAGVITLIAGNVSNEIDDLQRSYNVDCSAFITAYNPYGQPRVAGLNVLFQEKLLDDISGRWPYLYGEGADADGEWPSEPSLLILGIGLKEALALGQGYGQDAILFNDSNGKSQLEVCGPHLQQEISPEQTGADKLNAALKITSRQNDEGSNSNCSVTFIPTPYSLPPRTDSIANQSVRLSARAKALLAYVMRNNFICPQYEQWMEMWRMLPEINGCKPAGPIPLMAWPMWYYWIRHEFLVRHIVYADKQGIINEIDAYLRGLKSSNWVEGFIELL